MIKSASTHLKTTKKDTKIVLEFMYDTNLLNVFIVNTETHNIKSISIDHKTMKTMLDFLKSEYPKHLDY